MIDTVIISHYSHIHPVHDIWSRCCYSPGSTQAQTYFRNYRIVSRDLSDLKSVLFRPVLKVWKTDRRTDTRLLD